MKHATWTLFIVIVVVIYGGPFVMYSGLYNVSATSGEKKRTRGLSTNTVHLASKRARRKLGGNLTSTD